MEIWLLVFGAMALLLRAGFALHGMGSLRAKNSAGQVLRLTALMPRSRLLVFWAIGAAILMQTSNEYFGVDGEMVFSHSHSLADREFFYLSMILISGQVVGFAAAIAERMKFYVVIAVAAVFSGFVIPVAGHWALMERMVGKGGVCGCGRGDDHPFFRRGVQRRWGRFLSGAATGEI